MCVCARACVRAGGGMGGGCGHACVCMRTRACMRACMHACSVRVRHVAFKVLACIRLRGCVGALCICTTECAAATS